MAMMRSAELAKGLDVDRATGSIYLAFFASAPVVYYGLSDKDFSLVLTFSVLFQCLAFLLLSIRAQCMRSFVGISARTLELYAVAICFRLSSTLWLNGYLPLDRTGDMLYQIADIASLVLVCRLLHHVHDSKEDVRLSNFAERDTSIDVRNAIIVALLFAVAVHPDLDHKLTFDVLWATGLYLDAIAMIPQALVMESTGSCSESLTLHYFFCLWLSRALSGLFWFHGFEDVAPRSGVNYAGWGILAAHVVQILSLSDVVMRYFQVLSSRVEPSDAELQEV